MIAFKEKRATRRHRCRLKAKCAQFIRSVFYGADVLNVSKGGMFLETKLPVKPGVAMLIREIQHGSANRNRRASFFSLFFFFFFWSPTPTGA